MSKQCSLKNLRAQFLAGNFAAEQYKAERNLFALHCATCPECQAAVTLKYQANDSLVLQTLNQIAEDREFDDGARVLALMNIRRTPPPS